MLRIHLVRLPPSVEPEASCPATRQSNQIQEPATPMLDAYQRPKSQSTTVCHSQVTKVPGQAPHITTE